MLFSFKKFSKLDLGYAASLTYQSSPDFLNNFRVLLVVTHSSVAGLPQTHGYAENINKVPFFFFVKRHYLVFVTSTFKSVRGQKFHSPALERTSNSSKSNHPVGRVLWEELHILSSFTLNLRVKLAFSEY